MTAKERRRKGAATREAQDGLILEWLRQNPGPHTLRVMGIGMDVDVANPKVAARMSGSLRRLVRKGSVREGLRALGEESALTYEAVKEDFRPFRRRVY